MASIGVPRELQEIRSQVEAVIQRSREEAFDLAELVHKLQDQVQSQEAVLSETLPNLYSSCVERVERLKAAKSSREAVVKKVDSGLAASQDELKEAQDEKSSKSRRLEELTQEMELVRTTIHEVAERAMKAAKVAEQFPYLHSEKKIFYHVTRVHWDKVSKNEHVVKGFVINPLKNDVSTFVLNRRDLTDSQNHNILWDYIGAGVTSDWKRV